MPRYLSPGLYIEEKQSASFRRDIRRLNTIDRSPPSTIRVDISPQGYSEKKIEELCCTCQEKSSVIVSKGSLTYGNETMEEEASSYIENPVSIRSAILYDSEDESECWPNPYRNDNVSDGSEYLGLISLMKEKIERTVAMAKGFLRKHTEKISSGKM